jgi:hypothetical protein
MSYLCRRHFSVKQVEYSSAGLLPICSLAGAKQSFQRATLFTGKLNELHLSSHSRMIATAMAIYQNFDYKALEL